MRIVQIEKLENGAHCNQTIDTLSIVPKGWALIPEDMITENFPFGDITVEEIDGVPTVTSWVPGEIPEIPNPEKEPTVQDDIDTMLIDHEYRLTLLELEV